MTVDLSDDGERVVGSVHNWNYYSHLSIYQFAVPLMRGRRVLDAGCGTGYGTNHLAASGVAHVFGLDVSRQAIAYSAATFQQPNLSFAAANLATSIPLRSQSIDTIFSSQVMEHLADIENFMAECRRVLRPNGLLVMAVPAIVTPGQLYENIWNKYHLTNLTPLGWSTKVARSFAEIQAYRHWPSQSFSGWSAIRAALPLAPADTVIREMDFDFTPTPIFTLNMCADNLNTVLVARRPRSETLPPQAEEFIPHSWGEGAIHARVREEETKLLRWQLSQAVQTADEGRSDFSKKEPLISHR